MLSGDFQKSRELKHQSLELTQLIDTTGGSAKLTNAVKLVTAIRAQKFAALELETDEGFRVLDKKDAANEMVDHFQADPSSVWYLAETHGQANALTQWIRERLHGKKLLDTVEVGDLLEVYVSPDVRDAFGARVAGRLTVASVGKRTAYQQALSWVKSGPIKFHSIRCWLDSRDEIGLDVFDEFLSAEKPELDKETAVAEAVWRNAEKLYENRLKKYQRDQLAWESESGLPGVQKSHRQVGHESQIHHSRDRYLRLLVMAMQPQFTMRKACHSRFAT